MLVASMRRPPEILDDQGISQKSNRRGGTKWRSSSSWTIWRTRWAGWRSQMLSWCKVTTRMSSRVRLWCRIPCGHIIVPKDTNQESFSLALCGVSYGLFVTWRPWITITNNPNETPHKANDKMTIGHYDLKCGVQRPQAIGQLQIEPESWGVCSATPLTHMTAPAHWCSIPAEHLRSPIELPRSLDPRTVVASSFGIASMIRLFRVSSSSRQSSLRPTN